MSDNVGYLVSPGNEKHKTSKGPSNDKTYIVWLLRFLMQFHLPIESYVKTIFHDSGHFVYQIQ